MHAIEHFVQGKRGEGVADVIFGHDGRLAQRATQANLYEALAKIAA
jgi:hypothetical protein